MEKFTGLKASPLFANSTPLKTYKNMKGIDKQRVTKIVNINDLHDTLEKVSIRTGKNSAAIRTQAKKRCNEMTILCPLTTTFLIM